MATRPELHIAVAKQKSKASEYNDNFDMMLDYIDDSIQESKDYVDDYMPTISSSTSGKVLKNNGSNAIWDATSETFEYSGSSFNKKDVVLVDSLNVDTSNPLAHEDAVWLYATPVYPYVPMTTQNTGTSYTFTNGGMVMCTSATNVTVGQGNASITFNGFVGILPVSMGSVVTTSQTAYFVSY